MKNNPLVSIVVPVYNIEDYIKRCLDSLCAQTYEKIEIIVVDDGSTDKSGEICDEYAKSDDRVKVLHQKNKGLSGARNAGVKIARGDYVCLVDGDDYIEKTFVSEMALGVSDEVDIVICGYNATIPSDEVMTGEQATIKLLTKQDNLEIVAWNKMYKRELLLGYKYPEGENYEDTLTTYKILASAKKVKYIPKSLYIYSEREGSITSKNEKEKRLFAREKAAQEAIELFSDNKALLEASEIALLTANLAFADSAIAKRVDEKYFNKCRQYVAKNKDELLKNQFMTSKLKLYMRLLTMWNGKLYIAFRKIRHE